MMEIRPAALAAALWAGVVPAGVFVPALAETQDGLSRGAYLVKVTGCAGCHSPRNKDGEIIEDQRLTGGDRAIPSGDLGRFYPPNITSDEATGIGRWNEADIVQMLTNGLTPGGRILSTAMPWRTQYKDLTGEDKAAIAAYLKSLPPVRHQVPEPLPPLKAPAP